MKTNIVMLVKDRPKLTQQALKTLYVNTPNDSFNLTIIDDWSIEPVRMHTSGEEVLNSCMLRNQRSQRITGQARNLGVYWAEKYWGRGDFLYLTDNDVYFTPGWLAKLTDAYTRAAHCGVLGGWNHPFLQPKDAIPKYMLSYATILARHDAVTGASQLMWWTVWDDHGPLDAHAPGVGQSEDWKFCQDAIKSGYDVCSIYPRVVLNCGITNSFGLPSPGADVMLQELVEAKRQYLDLIWE